MKKKRFGMRNLIAGILTAAMVLTSTPTGIFADELLEVETEEAYEAYVDPAVDEAADAAPAEEASLSLFGEDDADEAVFSVSEDAEEETEADAAAENGEMTEEAAEAETEKETETETETETVTEVTEAYPAAELTDELNVSVEAPEGALPEGTDLSVEAADTEAAGQAAAGVVEGTVSGIAARDISFIYNDEEIDPKAKVTVTINTSEEEKAALAEADSLSLVHIPDAAEGETAQAELVPAEQIIGEVTADGVKFTADQFSVYAIVGTKTAAEEEVLLEEAEAEPAAAVTYVKAEGVRNRFYTCYMAELTGATVLVSVPSYAVDKGTFMEVSYTDADDYEYAVQSDNYGKVITMLKALNITFTNKRGKKVVPYGVRTSVSLNSDETGSEEYSLYENRYWNYIYKLHTSSSPFFDIYNFSSGSYVIAGLSSDGVRRAFGVTRNGVTTFSLNEADPSITVTAQKDTFSEQNVSLEFAPVDADTVTTSVGNAFGIFAEDADIRGIQAYDISFHSAADGTELEPRKDVTVAIGTELDESSFYSLVHIADDGSSEIVENAVFSSSGVTFSADEFSTYAIVATGGTLEEGGQYVIYYAADDDPRGYALTNKIGTTPVTVSNSEVSSEADNILWTVEKSSNNWRLYYMDGSTKTYLRMRGNNQLQTTTNENNDTNWSYRNYGLYSVSQGSYMTYWYGSFSGGYGNTPVRLAKYVPVKHTITVHYVNEAGQDIQASKTLGDSTTTDFLTTYDIVDEISGYTYHNTYLGSTSGTQIIPELKGVSGGGYAYQVYGGTERVQTEGNWEIKFNPITEDTDIYVVYGGEYAGSGSGSTGTGDDPHINQPKTAKDLVDNLDGTYTLSLSIKGESDTKDDTKGANVILVMDISKSMTNNENYVNGQSRLYWAKQSACSVANTLLAMNEGLEEPIVEMKLMSFNYSTNTSYAWHTSASNIIPEINGLTTDTGTNWEQALHDAAAEADAKKNGGDKDDTYIIFITDGNPSARIGTQSDGVNGTNKYTGESTYANNTQNSTSGNVYTYYRRCENYVRATDDARDIIQKGYHFYSVGIYGNVDVLECLTNFAYTGRSKGKVTDADFDPKHYYPAASTADMNNALSTIAEVIKKSVNVAGASFHDEMATDVTSTTLSATANGTATGVTYSKIGGTSPSYTVKVGSDGIPVFTVGGSSHNGTTKSVTYKKITKDPNTGAISASDASATVYSYTDSDNKEYRMAIASFGNDGNLDWDLSPLGTLEGGATYKISMIIWPNQDAYDYVAGLNNGLPGYTWDTSAQVPATDNDGNAYYKKGVSQYPNIVKYEDGTFAALTNVDQGVSYYIENKDGDNVTYTEGTPDPLKTPNPMKLTDTTSKITKKWEVDLAMKQLARFLYYTEDVTDSTGSHKAGDSRKVEITFKIFMDAAQPITDTTPAYTTVTLGWDEASNSYKWADESRTTVTENGVSYEIGTLWQEDFNISIGILLTTERMNALGLDKTKYTKCTYKGVDYYVLETGHDYMVSEPTLDYAFDFVNKVYHPMFINGELNNVTFAKNGTAITGIETVEAMNKGTGIMVWNYLRGGINIDKIVLDPKDHEIENDEEFTFNVTLTNSKENIFSGENIPWYSVNEKYYHDGEGNYITEAQARTAYGDNYQNYGNKLTPADNGTKASVSIPLTSKDAFRIANVPIGTNYSVVETQVSGYTLTSITKEIYLNSSSHTIYNTDGTNGINVAGRTVTGEIEPNRENNLTFRNKMSDYPGFFVYHSSDKSIEKITVGDGRVTAEYNETTKTYDFSGFNIVKETRAGNLYGGYYKAYSGSALTDDQIRKLSYEQDTSEAGIATEYDGSHKGGLWSEDTQGTPYTYANIQNIVDASTSKVSWDWEDVYTTESGDSMTPTVDTVYYLKEVPDNYLTNYVYAIYIRQSRKIETLYEMTAIDDCNYLGFALDSAYAAPGKTAVASPVIAGSKFVRAIKFKSFMHDDETVYGELKTTSESYKAKQASSGYVGENVFDPEGIKEGYLAYWSWGYSDKTYPLTFCPVWQTPDGIYVHGNFTGSLSFSPEGNNVDNMGLSKVRKN